MGNGMGGTENDRPLVWKQKEAAKAVGVSPSYLRATSCPKVLLPGNGAKGKPLVRYLPEEVMAWSTRHRA